MERKRKYEKDKNKRVYEKYNTVHVLLCYFEYQQILNDSCICQYKCACILRIVLLNPYCEKIVSKARPACLTESLRLHVDTDKRYTRCPRIVSSGYKAFMLYSIVSYNNI